MRRVLGTAMACIALVAAMAGPAAAATTTPVNCGTGADLQAAIDAASTGDTLLISGTCVGNFSAPKVLNFTGQGSAPTIAGGPVSTDPVLALGSGAIRGLTITGGLGYGVHNLGGSVTLTEATVRDNVGAGIVLFGPLTMIRSTVSGNAIGILAGGPGGSGFAVDIRNSSVRGNGVGMYNLTVTTLTDSIVSDNAGRGIVNVSSTSGRGVLTLVRSTVSGNTGGGIENRWQASIVDSKVMNNTTTANGGGIANLYEGATANFRGVLSITGSKVMNNTASNGGGIFNSGTPDVVTLHNVKIKNNTPNNCVGC